MIIYGRHGHLYSYAYHGHGHHDHHGRHGHLFSYAYHGRGHHDHHGRHGHLFSYAYHGRGHHDHHGRHDHCDHVLPIKHPLKSSNSIPSAFSKVVIVASLAKVDKPFSSQGVKSSPIQKTSLAS